MAEGNESNTAPVFYAIARRTEATTEIDLRKITLSWLKVKSLVIKPEYDLAILDIDPQINPQVADKLGILNSPPLHLNFDPNEREMGSEVEWLTTSAAEGDPGFTPRFFTGNIVSSYVNNEQYSIQLAPGKAEVKQLTGVRFLEVDKLFVPGASGSPILNKDGSDVIGYVHGYKPFSIATLPASESVEVRELDNAPPKKETIQFSMPLMSTISVGIDLRTAENFLRQEGLVASDDVTTGTMPK